MCTNVNIKYDLSEKPVNKTTFSKLWPTNRSCRKLQRFQKQCNCRLLCKFNRTTETECSHVQLSNYRNQKPWQVLKYLWTAEAFQFKLKKQWSSREMLQKRSYTEITQKFCSISQWFRSLSSVSIVAFSIIITYNINNDCVTSR